MSPNSETTVSANPVDLQGQPPGSFLVTRAPVPTQGWQSTAYKLTAGTWNAGLGAEEQQRVDLQASIRRPLRGIRRVAVLSLKGGVGKTTTTVGLGMTLASERGDRVLAVDANPDAGTLGERIDSDNSEATIRSLLDSDPEQITSYVQMRGFTSQDPSRLEVLAGDQDPAVSEALSDVEYTQVVGVLSRFYNIILTDCGTGLLHSAMSAVLDLADDVVIVVGAEVSAARKAGQTLDWLMAHGHEDLAQNAVAVISPATVGTIAGGKQTSRIDKEALTAYFTSRCRVVVEIPADPHLGLGAEVDLNQLQPATRLAYLNLADAIVGRF